MSRAHQFFGTHHHGVGLIVDGHRLKVIFGAAALLFQKPHGVFAAVALRCRTRSYRAE